MPEPLSYDFTPNFVGGVNSYFPANRIGNEFLTKAQNCIANEDGVLTRRPGLTQVGSLNIGAGESVVLPLDLNAAGLGTKRKLYFAYFRGPSFANMVSTWDGANWLSAVDITPGMSLGWFATSTWHRHGTDKSEHLYYAVATSGIAGRVSRIGITAKAVAPTPVALLGDTNADPPRGVTSITSAFVRLFASGDIVSNQEYVSYSGAGTNNNIWDRDKNNFPFFTERGDGVVGTRRYRENMLYVGMSSGTMLLAVGLGSNTLDGQEMIVSEDVGLISPKAVVNVTEDLLFVDQNMEVRALSQIMRESGIAVSSSPVSLPIRNVTDTADRDKVLTGTFLGFAKANLWFIFEDTDGVTQTYNYNIQTRGWYGPHIFKESGGNTLKIHGITSTAGKAGANWQSDGREDAVYILGDDGQSANTSFQVYELDDSVVTDDGTAIDVEAITKSDDMGSPMQEKQFRHGEVIFKKVVGTTGRFDLHARVDMELHWTKVLEVDYNTGDEDIQRRPFSLSGLKRGRELQFKITSSDANTNFQITRLVVTFHPYRLESA